ncbi:hypothetical protein BZM27_37195 [Paraburkholderia steynii]|uniref:Uncharacterized protein n=1 Tax=Paraburkholderia steynii TaxID=1245441 RepID=A0A4R0XD26_9BURK|nr:hypothetical protein BZM27_37195 [Paraburkholderia steynii]
MPALHWPRHQRSQREETSTRCSTDPRSTHENRQRDYPAHVDLDLEYAHHRRARTRPRERTDRQDLVHRLLLPARHGTNAQPGRQRRARRDARRDREHGLVPSVQASRMTLAAAPDALQGAVAAGILGCGSVILGASESCGKLLDEVRQCAAQTGGDLSEAAFTVITRYRADKRAVPGYGHPLHKERDTAPSTRCSPSPNAAARI